MSIWFWYRLESKDWCFRSRNGLNVITTLSRRVILCSKIAFYFKNPRFNHNFPEKRPASSASAIDMIHPHIWTLALGQKLYVLCPLTRCEGELRANSLHRLYLTTTAAVTSSIWKKRISSPGDYMSYRGCLLIYRLISQSTVGHIWVATLVECWWWVGQGSKLISVDISTAMSNDSRPR